MSSIIDIKYDWNQKVRIFMNDKPSFEINNIIRTAPLENLLVFLKEHPLNLNDPHYLAEVLFNNNDPKVFHFIYNEMSINSDDNFKEDIFDTLFFDKDALIKTVLLQGKKRMVVQSFLNTDDFPFVIQLNEDNIKKIQHILLYDKDIDFLEKPINTYNENMSSFLTKLILYCPSDLIHVALDVVNRNQENKKHFFNALLDEISSKKNDDFIISNIQYRLATDIINNQTSSDGFQEIEKFIKLSINKNSLTTFNMFINHNLHFYDKNSEIGLLYFDLLITEAFMEMKVVYEEQDYNIYKKKFDNHFYDEAIYKIMILFDSHKKSFIFKEDEQQLAVFFAYADYFEMNRTIVLLEKTKLKNNILTDSEPPVKNKKRI